MIATITTDDIHLQAGLPPTKLIKCMLQAEWLRKVYDKCNAQILQIKMLIINIHLPMCCVCISLPFQKTYEHKLFLVVKMKFAK